MKLYRLALFLVAVLAANIATAEIKVGIIDVRTALLSSEGAKAFSQKIASEFKTQELEVRSVHDEGQKLQARLKKDAALMSEKERAKLASELDEKAKEFKYLKGKLDSALAKRKQEFLKESKPKLDKILQELVEEEKLDLVMPREATVFHRPALDLTAKVIEKLNKLK